MRPDGPRDPVAGADSGPEPPFPLKLCGKVIKGFGRGSKELGIPTANIPLSGLTVGGHDNLESGIYFGWAGLEGTAPVTGSEADGSDELAGLREGGPGAAREPGNVYPMVMSVGWNPFYKNTVRSVEVHIIHKFEADFYGRHLNLLMLGFIRPEYDYVDKESLIKDIRTDIDVAIRSLARPAYAAYREDEYLMKFPDPDGVEKGDVAS